MSVVVRWVHSQLVEEARRLVERCRAGGLTRGSDPAPKTDADVRWAEGVVADLEGVDLSQYADTAAFLAQADVFARNRPSEPDFAEPTQTRDEFVRIVLALRTKTIRAPSPLEQMGMDRSRLVLASCVQLTLHTVIERDDWRRVANEPPSEVITLVGANLWHQRSQDSRRFDLTVPDADVLLTLARGAAAVRVPPGRTTAVERPVTYLRLFVEDGLDGTVIASTMAINHYASISPIKEPWRSLLSFLVLGLDPDSESWTLVRKRLLARLPEPTQRQANAS